MSITTPIYNMFAKSPLRPLQEHMNAVQTCVDELQTFMHAVYDRQWDVAERSQNKISRLENEADELKKNLRLSLPRNLFMPVPRGDVIETLLYQDKVANCAKDIAGLILGRKMLIPDHIVENYQKLLTRSIDAARQATKAINELDELVETGFKGNEVKLVEDMIHELDAIEHDTDEIQIIIRRQLFEIEEKLSPIDVIFLYKIIEWTGELADRAQKVGGQLELLIAR